MILHLFLYCFSFSKTDIKIKPGAGMMVHWLIPFAALLMDYGLIPSSKSSVISVQVDPVLSRWLHKHEMST